MSWTIPLQVDENPDIVLLQPQETTDVCMAIDEKIVIADGEYYDGEYEALPSPARDQDFETAGKLMASDMTFKKIPYSETSNEFGGNTITIG